MTKTQNLTKVALAIAISISLSSCAVNPKVITPEQRSARIQQDWQAMFQGQESVTSSINIYQAMARAIKYNLDIRVKSMETAYALADAKYTQSTMLPSIVTSAGYTTRNNNYSVRSPENPNVISTTEDRDQTDANLQFAWNALDFGVSYIQSKQKADLYLIAQERKRKIIQQVIRDTRYAYWRAWAAQQLLGQVNSFRGEIQQAINQSETAANEKLTSPTDAAYYRAELWQEYKDMSNLQDQLSNARPELLAMMNLRPTSNITLTQPSRMNGPLPKGFPKNSNTLEMMALQNRPELREEDYRNRISLNEIKKAQLKMLPNLGINAGVHYDSNSFLVNNNWADFGSQLSWDVLRIFSNYHGIKVAKAEQQVGNIRRMALSMAVVTQIEIAKLRYQQAVRDLNIAENLRNARYQYDVNLSNEQKANLSDNLAVITAKAKWLVAKLGYYTAYAELQNAAGQLLDSVGYDPLNSVTSVDVPVNTLAQQIQVSMSNAPIPISGSLLATQNSSANANIPKTNNTKIAKNTASATNHYNKESYSIQLMADEHKAFIMRFMKQNNLTNKATIQHKYIDGKHWYILLYGNYDSIPAAESAIKTLPNNLRQRNPWVRPIP